MNSDCALFQLKYRGHSLEGSLGVRLLEAFPTKRHQVDKIMKREKGMALLFSKWLNSEHQEMLYLIKSVGQAI